MRRTRARWAPLKHDGLLEFELGDTRATRGERSPSEEVQLSDYHADLLRLKTSLPLEGTLKQQHSNLSVAIQGFMGGEEGQGDSELAGDFLESSLSGVVESHLD